MENNISTALIKYLVKDGEKTLAQKQLETILNKDIHENSLGCKIPETHIRIGKVHLNTFYEAQLLFGNAYWTDIFACYFYDFIISKLDESQKIDKKRPIILYGYETYSTLTLNKTITFLERDGYSVNLRVFEIKEKRVRYCDESIDSSVDESLLSQNPIMFLFIGISSTLSTFNYMNSAITELNNKYSEISKFCTSIIQVTGNNNSDDSDCSNDFIEMCCDEYGPYVKCSTGEQYLNFINTDERKAYYYVSVEATWHKPENCKLCMPKNYINEYPLIEVDEASVVPTQMIRLNVFEHNNLVEDPIEAFSMENSKLFFKDSNNSKYLRYGHIERNENHFRYYLRLSRLYHDKKNDIENWLNKIKDNYPFTSKKTINIIIAPQHYSNTGYVNSVNRIIFNGTAHIIEFDINKEYRSNFRAKYNNYFELEKIVSELKDYSINFYYVNDQIVSGNTFNRSKSLVMSLFKNLNVKDKLNVFQGVFVLFNRNSFDTRKNYVNVLKLKRDESEIEYLPYFSYLNLDIPSFRNHDDSCPICFNKNKSLEIIKECALDSTVFYWQEKIVHHRLKNVNEVRKSKTRVNIKERHFRRLSCENDLWISVKRAYKLISDFYIQDNGFAEKFNKRDCIIDSFFETINLRFSELVSDEDKIEYLISYIKAMSRALLYYQEDVKKATLYILLKIFDYYCTSVLICNPDFLLHFSNNFPIGDNFINLNLNEDKDVKLQYDLFCIVVSCLCDIGSCVLLDLERLNVCRNIGNILAKKCNRNDFESFLLNSIKKLLCYDKGKSKAEVLQTNILNKIDCSDNFYKKLYLENTRAPELIKSQCFINEIINLDKSNTDITKKYTILANIIEKEIANFSQEEVEIRFFTVTNDENSYKVIDISEGNISAPNNINDFYFDEESGVSFISIGNNYGLLKEKYDSKTLENELKIVKNAKIILGINTSNFSLITKILQYRREILQMVESDFKNDAIPKLRVTRGQAEVLSEAKTVTHNNNPLSSYETVFNDLCFHKIPLETQRKFLTLYMNTVISMAYREQLRFEVYKFSSLKNENSMFCFDYCPVGGAIDYIENQLVDEYNGAIKLKLGKFSDNNFIEYNESVQNNLKEAFKNNYAIVRFRRSIEQCEAYMLLKTGIENAYRHCSNPTINLYLADNNDSFDLIIENTINQKKNLPSDKGITIEALKYIFNKTDCSGHNEVVFDAKEIDNNIFQIKFKKFIIRYE